VSAALAEERDIRLIEALYYDYAAAIDEEVERWPNLFTEDARYRVTSRENYDRNLPLAPIYCEGRGMILDRAMAVRETTVYATRFMRHAITNVQVTDNGEGTFTARANFAIYETFEDTISRLFAVGRYIDTIVRIGETLLFRDKLCVLDSNIVIGSLIYPV
jgi:3-phenylpropionate/cinnamic acid dioxygenase small subunit